MKRERSPSPGAAEYERTRSAHNTRTRIHTSRIPASNIGEKTQQNTERSETTSRRSKTTVSNSDTLTCKEEASEYATEDNLRDNSSFEVEDKTQKWSSLYNSKVGGRDDRTKRTERQDRADRSDNDAYDRRSVRKHTSHNSKRSRSHTSKDDEYSEKSRRSEPYRRRYRDEEKTRGVSTSKSECMSRLRSGKESKRFVLRQDDERDDSRGRNHATSTQTTTRREQIAHTSKSLLDVKHTAGTSGDIFGQHFGTGICDRHEYTRATQTTTTHTTAQPLPLPLTDARSPDVSGSAGVCEDTLGVPVEAEITHSRTNAFTPDWAGGVGRYNVGTRSYGQATHSELSKAQPLTLTESNLPSSSAALSDGTPAQRHQEVDTGLPRHIDTHTHRRVCTHPHSTHSTTKIPAHPHSHMHMRDLTQLPGQLNPVHAHGPHTPESNGELGWDWVKSVKFYQPASRAQLHAYSLDVESLIYYCLSRTDVSVTPHDGECVSAACTERGGVCAGGQDGCRAYEQGPCKEGVHTRDTYGECVNVGGVDGEHAVFKHACRGYVDAKGKRGEGVCGDQTGVECVSKTNGDRQGAGNLVDLHTTARRNHAGIPNTHPGEHRLFTSIGGELARYTCFGSSDDAMRVEADRDTHNWHVDVLAKGEVSPERTMKAMHGDTDPVNSSGYSTTRGIGTRETTGDSAHSKAVRVCARGSAMESVSGRDSAYEPKIPIRSVKWGCDRTPRHSGTEQCGHLHTVDSSDIRSPHPTAAIGGSRAKMNQPTCKLDHSETRGCALAHHTDRNTCEERGHEYFRFVRLNDYRTTSLCTNEDEVTLLVRAVVVCDRTRPSTQHTPTRTSGQPDTQVCVGDRTPVKTSAHTRTRAPISTHTHTHAHAHTHTYTDTDTETHTDTHTHTHTQSKYQTVSERPETCDIAKQNLHSTGTAYSRPGEVASKGTGLNPQTLNPRTLRQAETDQLRSRERESERVKCRVVLAVQMDPKTGELVHIGVGQYRVLEDPASSNRARTALKWTSRGSTAAQWLAEGAERCVEEMLAEGCGSSCCHVRARLQAFARDSVYKYEAKVHGQLQLRPPARDSEWDESGEGVLGNTRISGYRRSLEKGLGIVQTPQQRYLHNSNVCAMRESVSELCHPFFPIRIKLV
ncbi:hypothetical protein SARC_07958 [Sphaeroforma arctica JP610]|uniref:Uncharacterized protein n=1 Tax=Sphaeroforma arctica JP610 TaxID=667725 RepID=A0A0L0FS83_9EUKA|nr:hypothetical protein SARC_07958 [Sphaeroforma arctica JP610]KNC79657.1 hypothetical protein SARC_07958 [Sphaeroforma arctica JP610]|eukprot:XP_014153559.1 hypothetical protein SARC_07958 [Sphaeroforma arctica JP610]